MNKNALFIREVMRITILIYTVIISFSQLLLAEPSNGQVLERSVNITFKNSTLYAAIQHLQMQSQVEFAFDEKLLKLEKIDVKAKHFQARSVAHVLDALLEGTPITYIERDPHTVVLRKKQPNGTVSGRVIDGAGLPLAGANIRILELNKSVSTNEEGPF